MIEINYKEYRELVESGATTHLHNIKSNRAETINYDGEIYSAELFSKEHHYNWRAFPNGREWYYRAESGKEIKIVDRRG